MSSVPVRWDVVDNHICCCSIITEALWKVVGLHVDSHRDTITTHRLGISSAASFEIFLRKPVDFTGPKCFHFQTLKIFQCRGFICRMFWQRAQGNLQLPAGHFGIFSFENYADQSLDRRQKLIGMRLRMMFFIYGMNGSKILLQMHTLIHGLASHAKTTGIWPGMLPLYLQPTWESKLHALQVRKSGIMEKSGWRRVELTFFLCEFTFICHILPHVNSSCVHNWVFCACALKRARHWRAGLTWPDVTTPTENTWTMGHGNAPMIATYVKRDLSRNPWS